MIRKAIPNDLDAIKSINQQIFDYECAHCDPFENIDYPNTKAGNDFFDSIVNETNGHFGYVYEDDNIIKGYVSLRIMDEKEYDHRINIKPLQLQTIGVLDKYRKQGIGKDLTEYAIRIAKEKGYSHLRVCALAKNDRARQLYLSAGFHEQEIMHEINL